MSERLFLVIVGEINQRTPLLVLDELKRNKVQKLNLILDSPGGSVSSAYKIVNLIYKYTEKNSFDVYVTNWAKSAATFICLGATKIYISDTGELGPIDPQIYQETHGKLELFPVTKHDYAKDICVEVALQAFHRMNRFINSAVSKMSLNKMFSHSISFATQVTRPLFEQLEPPKLAQYRSFVEEVLHYAKLLKKQNKNLKSIEAVTQHLIEAYPSHGFVIGLDELKDIGFDAEKMDDGLLDGINQVLSECYQKNEEQEEEKGHVFSVTVKDGEENVKATET